MPNLAPAPPRYQWRSRFAAAAWTMSLIGLVVLGGWLAYAAVGELGQLLQTQLPTPPEVSSDVIVANAEDAEGRRATFRILLFTDEFRWRLSSFNALDAEPERPEFTAEMKAVLNDAREIICVGASSEEFPAGVSPRVGRRAEERRAGRRAERIAGWVREVLSKPIPVRKLNVGHHAPTGRLGDTADQRRVVIILVLDHDAGTNLDQALRGAMTRESTRSPIFETLLTRYSLASAQQFTWVP
jgi:hypothetical protein